RAGRQTGNQRRSHCVRGQLRRDDGYELEVTFVSAPHHDPVVIGRSQTGNRCQITLERWLPVGGEPGIQDAVNAIRAILAASACPDPVKISDKATESEVSWILRPCHASSHAS